MKKLLALALNAAMVFSLAACGSAPAAPAAPAEGEAAVEVEAEAAAEVTTTELNLTDFTDYLNGLNIYY